MKVNWEMKYEIYNMGFAGNSDIMFNLNVVILNT